MDLVLKNYHGSYRCNSIPSIFYLNPSAMVKVCSTLVPSNKSSRDISSQFNENTYTLVPSVTLGNSHMKPPLGDKSPHSYKFFIVALNQLYKD